MGCVMELAPECLVVGTNHELMPIVPPSNGLITPQTRRDATTRLAVLHLDPVSAQGVSRDPVVEWQLTPYKSSHPATLWSLAKASHPGY